MSLCQEKELNLNIQSAKLSSLGPGSSAMVVSIPEHPLLYSLGLRPGKIIQCCGCQLFGGPLMIKTGDRQVALSKIIAEKIIVEII